MNVTFASLGEQYASGRYRGSIPQAALADLGVPRGHDWLVIGKHGWSWDDIKGFRAVCFDVCDDHFSGQWKEHYHTSCLRADLVTCNSEEMARIIHHFTGRDAVVIPDPYEQPECAPEVHGRLLWYGHGSNLCDIAPYVGSFKHLQIVTNAPGFTQWSPRAMDKAFNECGLVVIPTGKSMAKSGNRAIESIRRGRYVVAGFLPAYADLGIYVGDIKDGVRWCLDHEAEVIKRIASAQEYVRDAYSPHRIGELWLKALSS